MHPAEVPSHDPRRVLDTPDVRQVLSETLARGRYIDGERVAQFEQHFAQFLGVAHCVGVGNGTDALEIALRSVGVGQGDPVITVANAGFYASSAILACGARPVYVEVDARSMLMSPASLRNAMRSRPAAVVYTPLYGDTSGGPDIAAICAEAGVALVADCAHAPGPRPVRGVSAATFSFYPTKNLPAAGDGGAVASDDAAVARRARQLSRYGWSSRFHVERPGRNSRLDELQAAVLLHGLSALSARTSRRVGIWQGYADVLRGSAWSLVGEPEHHLAHLAVLTGPDIGGARQVFANHGIQTDVHYPVLDHEQPGLPEAQRVRLPVTESLVGRIVTIPCFPELRDAEVARVAEALKEIADV